MTAALPDTETARDLYEIADWVHITTCRHRIPKGGCKSTCMYHRNPDVHQEFMDKAETLIATLGDYNLIVRTLKAIG